MSDEPEHESLSLKQGMTVHQALEQIKHALLSFGVENASQETKWILAHCLKISPSELIQYHNHVLSVEAARETESYISMRKEGIPLSRVLGVQEFWGLPMFLNDHTLDPRQDTELIPERVVKTLPKVFKGCGLDLGTGSGCIAIALLSEFPEMTFIGLDISDEALSQARENANLNGVGNRFMPVCSNWDDSLGGRFPLIVSNPPYIPSDEIKNLEKNVQDFDPIPALDGGKDGLYFLKKTISTIKNHLSPEGTAFIEIGFDQHQEMERLIEKSGLTAIDVHHDIAGIPRVVEISYGDK